MDLRLLLVYVLLVGQVPARDVLKSSFRVLDRHSSTSRAPRHRRQLYDFYNPYYGSMYPFYPPPQPMPIVVTLRNNYNVRYVGNIAVGRPPQSLQLIFDTGSSLVWVPRHACKSWGVAKIKCDDFYKTYAPERSAVAQLLRRNSLNITYALGRANGDLVKDSFWIGPENSPTEVQGLIFGAMNSIKDLDYGMLGLGPKRKFIGYSSFFNELVVQNLVPRSIFTVSLNYCVSRSCDDGGRVVLGGFDSQNCESDVIWTENISDRHWTFKLDGITVNGKRISGPYKAITDNGHSYTQFTHDVFLRLRQAANITMYKHKGKPTTFELPCRSDFGMNIVVNRQNVYVPGWVFMKKAAGNSCLVTIMEGDRDYFILGQAFFRAVCNIHDYDGNRIGFSQIRHVYRRR